MAIKCTATRDLYVKFRGAVETHWYKLTGLPFKGQRRGGNTVYINSGTLSKVRGEVGTQCKDPQDLYLNFIDEVGTQCRDTQGLYLMVRVVVGTQCTQTQELYLKVRGGRAVGQAAETNASLGQSLHIMGR